MISIKQLIYARAVTETLHFKKAAERCHISQSALSTALSELLIHPGSTAEQCMSNRVL